MRAVHLEVAKSQTVGEFQMKLNAIITRRTRPQLMISDNAQVFKSTANWIRNIRKSEKLQDFLAKQKLHGGLILPSPHRGALCMRGS